MQTKDRLAQALREAGYNDLADRAATGEFDDYLSPHPLPQIVLMRELSTRENATGIRKRIIAGEWDATTQESDEWWEREGKALCQKEGLDVSMFERKRS
jgi:hypothetical protein